jgi:hypothetical protein
VWGKRREERKKEQRRGIALGYRPFFVGLFSRSTANFLRKSFVLRVFIFRKFKFSNFQIRKALLRENNKFECRIEGRERRGRKTGEKEGRKGSEGRGNEGGMSGELKGY